jgi:hypothetical protein
VCSAATEAHRGEYVKKTHWAMADSLRVLTIDPDRTELIVSLILCCLRDAKRRLLVAAKFKLMLERIHDSLSDLRVPNVVYFIGGMTQMQRQRAKHARVVLSTIQMCKESFDVAELNTLIMAHPFGDIEQVTGRIVRRQDPDVRPLIIDIVDDFAHYRGMAWKRRKQYISLGYTPVRIRDDDPKINDLQHIGVLRRALSNVLVDLGLSSQWTVLTMVFGEAPDLSRLRGFDEDNNNKQNEPVKDSKNSRFKRARPRALKS